jgi:WD40 repeat protein
MLHTDGELLALGITSDGVLWSVEEPGELRSWNLITRRHLTSRPLGTQATLWAFNWAGRLLASASDELTVWECNSGEQLHSWDCDAWITAIAFQPFTRLLATGHEDGVVRIWDWSEQSLLRELSGHERSVSAISFSWDGKRVATAGEEQMIRLWGLPGGRQVGTLEGHTDRIPAMVWHPDNQRLFSAGWDTTVRVWDTNKGEPIILLNSHATQVHALALSGDGGLLASADSGNAVHIWDTHQYQPHTVLRDQTAEVRCLAFTPDDGRGNLKWPLLTYGGVDRIIYLWDSQQGPGGAGSPDAFLCRTAVAVSRDARLLYSLGMSTPLRAWDVHTGQPKFTLTDDPPLRSFARSPNGKWLAASRMGPKVREEDRNTLALYDASSGQRQVICDGQPGPITALAFNSDSTLLASGGPRSSDVWLWSVPTGQPHLLVPDAIEGCSIEALAFQPGGGGGGGSRLLAVAGIDWLATSGADGQVVLWSLDNPKRTTMTFPGGASALAFSPDGRHLAIANLKRIIRVYQVSNGAPVCELTGHLDTIFALSYSPDGKWLASGGEDRTVRLWSTATGALRGAWELDNPIKALDFSPDGKYLYTGNANTSSYQIEVEQLLASMA